MEFSQQELREVVERAQKGSLADFQQLYAHFSKPIYNFIWKMVGSIPDAEDLTQETFLKVHNELSKLRDPAQFKFWLYRIARNEVYQKLRREQRSSVVSINDDEIGYFDFLEDESPGLDPEKQVLTGELKEVIQETLNAMSPKYRDVFILAVFQKVSYEDITKIVGRSLLSVKTDIYRARLMIKDRLKAYMERAT